MIAIRSSLLLLLALFVASCDNSATDPNTKKEDPKKPIDSTGFAIVAASQDTFYFGEHAWMDVNDLGKNVGDLRLFVHTVEVETMWIEGGRLNFTVPANASTGKLRLYKQDTLLAKNDFTLHVLPHDRIFATALDTYYPAEGYPGEKIYLNVIDLPLRRSEFDVLLDDQKLKVLQWNAGRLVVEVPEGKKTGRLQLRSFDNMLQVGSFEVLEHDGIFVDKGRISGVTVQAVLLGNIIETVANPDSTNRVPIIAISISPSFKEYPSVTYGDSIYIKGLSDELGVGYEVDVALKQTVGRNLFSGRIVVKAHYEKGTQNEMIQTTTLWVKDIPWKRVSNYYMIYANGEDVNGHVVDVQNILEYPHFNYVSKVEKFTGGDSTSFVSVTFFQ